MSRASHHHPALRYAMPIAVLGAAVLGLLPVKYTGWLDGPAGLVQTVLTPISHPLRAVAGWLAPADRDRLVGDAELERQADHYEWLWRREQAETARLRRQVEELERGRAFRSEVPVDLLRAPVVGGDSDPASSVFTVRAGRDDGVTANTVVVVDAVQLVGRVRSVAASTCDVKPITDRTAGPIDGVILLDPAENLRVGVFLDARDNGRLRGVVEYAEPVPGQPEPPALEPGMEVRLDDPAWPVGAQMLLLGKVERVETRPDQPLRKIVYVKPRVQLRRVTEVVLRIPMGTGGTDREAAP